MTFIAMLSVTVTLSLATGMVMDNEFELGGGLSLQVWRENLEPPTEGIDEQGRPIIDPQRFRFLVIGNTTEQKEVWSHWMPARHHLSVLDATRVDEQVIVLAMVASSRRGSGHVLLHAVSIDSDEATPLPQQPQRLFRAFDGVSPSVRSVEFEGSIEAGTFEASFELYSPFDADKPSELVRFGLFHEDDTLRWVQSGGRKFNERGRWPVE